MARERIISMAMVVAAFSVAIIVMLTNGTNWWWVVATAALGVGFLAFTARRGRHTPWATARRRLGPGHAVVFWKPGCTYCEALLRRLGKDERVTWVNVWVDKDANAEVRSLNGGDELTPTAVVGERVLRNPSAQELLESLGAGQGR